tara:strand:- start:226 stop:894 length:669 start_codon:yes stop_codon:yes gene_type:complete
MYTQQNPSQTYQRLVATYQGMHANGYKRMVDGREIDVAPEAAFPGDQLPHFAHTIKEMIDMTQAKTVLDYGCGKGTQYEKGPFKDDNGRAIARNIQNFWGVDSIHLYDPGVPKFATYPTAEFDGVVSTDVLEHIPREDVFWVADEMVARARKFLFVNIACYPAIATLPDGTNAHVTVEHPRWWAGVFESAALRKGGLKVRLVCAGDGSDNMASKRQMALYDF